MSERVADGVYTRGGDSGVHVGRPGVDGPFPEDRYEHLVIRRMKDGSCFVEGIDFLDRREAHELYGENDGKPEKHDFLLIDRECPLRDAINQLVAGYEAGRRFTVGVDQMKAVDKEVRQSFVEALDCLANEDFDWRRGFSIAAAEGFSNHRNLAELADIVRDELLGEEAS